MEITQELLKKLPKTDLHCHLDGSVRPETILELGKKYGVKLPAEDPKKLREYLEVGDKCKNLEEYLERFGITLSVMQTEEAIERISYELAIDAAAENVWYLEVRFSPILHQEKGLSLIRIVNAALIGLTKAEKETNIKTGLIICGMRNIKSEISLKLAEITVAFKNRGVVGFDLAGAEFNYPAKKHAEAFYLIRNNNVKTTLHAGEAYGPESIAQAIHDCGAQRIGHGTRLKENGDLLNYVNDLRIPLEVCISSNVQTKSVSKMEEHPLRFYFDYGLRVTINTDNRLMSATTVSKELWIAHKNFNFDLKDIKLLILNGFKSVFLPYKDKVDLLDKVIHELKKYSPDDKEAKLYFR
ncbi:adenosine deaminase [bacterium]|nr:adenosine deaminase [bacterium]